MNNAPDDAPFLLLVHWVLFSSSSSTWFLLQLTGNTEETILKSLGSRACVLLSRCCLAFRSCSSSQQKNTKGPSNHNNNNNRNQMNFHKHLFCPLVGTKSQRTTPGSPASQSVLWPKCILFFSWLQFIPAVGMGAVETVDAFGLQGACSSNSNSNNNNIITSSQFSLVLRLIGRLACEAIHSWMN